MKNAKEIPLLEMTLPCEEKKFLEYTEEYLFSIFRSCKNFDEKKISLSNKVAILQIH